MTKFSEGLAPVGAKAKLYTTVAEILRSTGVDVDKALPRIVKLMQRDHGLLAAMSHDYTRVHLLDDRRQLLAIGSQIGDGDGSCDRLAGNDIAGWDGHRSIASQRPLRDH